jgi:lipopolysaccharide/colanic/teichoic acid biosynthesis glycosyltransferase
MYRRAVKPFFDFIVAVSTFLVLFPIFLLITLLLAVFMGGNPFFVQTRPGQNERLFKIVKFRTMTNKRDVNGDLLPDAQRLTGIGKLVRTTSLDEIPQLLNVIIGDMSIVGPRPLLPEYLPLYNEFQKKRHLVKPGITGYAQVNGRNAIGWEEKFELDVYYVEHVNFSLDVSIILKTIRKVFLREGITARNTATMNRFKGTKE